MQRAEANLALRVHLLAILTNGPEAGGALVRIDPGLRDHPANRLNPVLDRKPRGNRGAKAHALQHLDPALARAQLAGLGVVRQDQRGVEIGPLTKRPRIPVEGNPVVLDVVDQPDFAAHELRQPNGRRVRDPEVEGRVNLKGGIMRNPPDPTALFRFQQQPGVIGALDRGIERTLKLAGKLVVAHLGPQRRQFLRRDQARLTGPQDGQIPLVRRARPVHQVVKAVLALRRPDEAGPAVAVSQRRADHLRPGPRVHVAVFVQHHAVEVDTAHPVVVVGAVKPDPVAGREVHPQFGLVDRHSGDLRRIPLQIAPGHVLGLRVIGRDVGEAAIRQGVKPKRRVHQVHDRRHRLSGPAMRHDGREAFPAGVVGDEGIAGPILQVNPHEERRSQSRSSCRPRRPRPSTGGAFRSHGPGWSLLPRPAPLRSHRPS